MTLSRRDVLRAAGALALARGGIACARPGGEPGALRIAYMGNLTHAPMVAGLTSGRIAAALAPLRVTSRVVNAGPRVVEALLGGTVDVGVAGPAAVVAACALHGPVLTIVAGVCSGGASFVLHRGEREDALAHKTLATPQLGSTQDVSLRKFLRAHGNKTADHGGDVHITQLPGALAKVELSRGALAGAWMPEPWATRLVLEAPAFRAFDERDLWPGGDFASAILVARTDFLRERPDDVARIARALADETRATHRDESRDALSRVLHMKWDARVWSEAWERVRFTTDTMREAIAAFARDAHDVGALRVSVDATSLFAT